MNVNLESFGSVCNLEKGQFFVRIHEMCNAERKEDVKVYLRISSSQSGHFGATVSVPVTFVLPTSVEGQYVLRVPSPELTDESFKKYKRLCEDNMTKNTHALSGV